MFTSYLVDFQYVMAHLPKTAQGEELDDVELCRQLVEDYGIAIIPGTYCGFPGWIRVCYANLPPGDMCRQAAERLQLGIQEIVLHKK
jgi:aspartate/methionine/tyrosine aminotransferase